MSLLLKNYCNNNIQPLIYKICATALLIILFVINSNAQSQTIPAGSVIIDMGVLPQSINNAIKPYGLVYELVHDRYIPVIWSVNPLKAKDGIDFTVDGRDFSGGPFIISAPFLSDSNVLTTISAWQAKGVVTYTTLTDATVDVYQELHIWSQWVLDTDKGDIAQTYLDLADIPASAYRFGYPSSLTPCDDLFILPHADPTWADHGYLYDWNDSFSNGGSEGWIWAACHGVSALESLYNPSDPSQQLNFLSNKTGPATLNGSDYFENSLILWANHNDASNNPFSYAYPQDGYMQFMGVMDEATKNGSEQIYLPVNGTNSGWRSTTTIAVWDPLQSDVVAGSSPGEAALLAYGPGFGDPSRGSVMYQAGHQYKLTGRNPAPLADVISGIRAFLNFSFLAPTSKAPQITDNIVVPLSVRGGDTLNFDVDASSTAGNSYTFNWTSTCANGSFSGTSSTSNNSTTSFVTTPVLLPQQCTITVTVTDFCGRISYNSYILSIMPPANVITNRRITYRVKSN